METNELSLDEIRNATKAGTNKEKLQKCAICGKPESRNTSKVNDACPTHKRIVEEGIVEKFRALEKALGSNLLDFVRREKFNAQYEAYRALFKKAREEHDAYQPVEPVSERAQVHALLGECLALLGHDTPEIPEGGKVDLLALAARVKVALSEASKVEAPEAPEVAEAPAAE